MRKTAFLLSMLAVLSACSSESEIKDENELPPGIMQPVSESGAVDDGSWMPEIQQQSMPINMQ